MNLYFTVEFRRCLDLLSPSIGLRTCSSLICNASVQFQMKIRKISRRRSRSPKYPELSHFTLLESFSKSRRQRQRERQQTKGLMSRTMVLHVRFDSLYISFPSSAKQQREMTKFYVFWSTRTAMANFSCLPLELNAVITYLA